MKVYIAGKITGDRGVRRNFKGRQRGCGCVGTLC